MSETIDDAIVTKTDVMNFIESNPYFDEMLKIFLKDKFVEDVDGMVVSEEWEEEFVRRVRRHITNTLKKKFLF